MGSMINEKTFSLNSQMASCSRSSLLMSNIEFKRNDDETDMMSTKCLQSKYNVLTADHKMCSNGNEFVKLNGQTKSNNAVINGSISDSNADGIPVAKFVLYPQEKVHVYWKEPHKIGAGLANLGNTCFMNSVLQCLSYCPPLVNFLLHSDDDHISKCKIIGFCMTCELIKHIKRAFSHSGETIKPVYICQRLKSIAKHFTFGRQEDAHEFLRYVIDNMWRSCLTIHEFNINFKLDSLSKETTAINQIFGGYHRSQVICFQCKEKSNTYDYFMDFMLDIKNVISLEKALEKFVQLEILQHDNAYKCPRCKRKVLAKKQFTVFRAPNVATFQLKRFDYNRMFGGKITKLITYPEKLNLRPYMSENKGPPILYKLNSVLVHLGPTCNSGHYFCYVRNSNGYWYLMDDSRVVQVNLNQVMNQQAYVLFYVRVDNDFHKPNPVKNHMFNLMHGIKLSNIISSPEMSYVPQKYNYNLHNGNLMFAQTKPTSSTTISTNSSDGFKHVSNMNGQKTERKSCESTLKGLVPYASDSSDDESGKQSSCMNGDINCDKENKKLSISSANELGIKNNCTQQKSSTERIDNSSHKCISISSQSIPASRLNGSVQSNNISDLNNCPPLAPITLKVKSTTSSWHVVETCKSPSIASGESTNSVNSSTEWTISTDCPSDCNGGKHVKFNHHKHRTKHNHCASIVNRNVNPVLSTKIRLPHDSNINETQSELKIFSESQTQSSSEAKIYQNNSNLDSKLNYHNEIKSENVSPEKIDAVNGESIMNDKRIEDSNEHIEKISTNLHSKEIFSKKEENNKMKEKERNSLNNSHVECDDEEDKHLFTKVKKHRKHKFSSHNHNMRRNSSSDMNNCEDKVSLKSKRKKKKLKKHRHKQSSSSESESNTSSDNQLLWIERTKETLDKEKKFDSNTKTWDEDVRDLAQRKRKLNNIMPSSFNGSDNSETVNELLKSSFRDFGDKVNSWNGGPSSLKVSSEENNRNYADEDDEYNNEYDRGKTKKIKLYRNDRDFHYGSNNNPFQHFQSYKHGNNGAFNNPNKSWNNKRFFNNTYNNNNNKLWTHRYNNDRRR